MMNFFLKTLCFGVLIWMTSHSGYAQTHKLKFETSFGEFEVMLYDFTPKHRDLMLAAVRNGEYHEALFNRIIENFVVQGGEHDIAIANREAGQIGHPKPRLAAEFDARAFHKMGALGAGRDDNPEKASFLNQIYFVVGSTVVPSDLDRLEQKKNIRYTDDQKAEYLAKGGLPRLDGDYTVFGEITQGLDVVLKISRVTTDAQDFPLQNVVFNVYELPEER